VVVQAVAYDMKTSVKRPVIINESTQLEINRYWDHYPFWLSKQRDDPPPRDPRNANDRLGTNASKE